MEVLRGRRLFGILFVFMTSFCLRAVLPFYFCLAFAVMLIASFAVYAVVMKRRRMLSAYRVLYMILALLALAFGILHAQRYLSAVPEDFYSEESREYCGTVKSEEGSAGYYSIYLINIDHGGKEILCLCEADYGADFEAGDKVVIFGTAAEESDIYYKSRGVCARINFTESHISSFGEEKTGFFARKQKYFSSLFDGRLEGDALSLAKAMLLGERDTVSGEIRLDFRRIGFSHVLAVSGLHISVLTFAFMLLLAPLPMSKRMKNLLLIPVVCAFALITGASASVIRSCIMFICLAASGALLSDDDAPTSLVLAVSLLFIFSPSSVFDIGLWLSFSATLGIVLFAPVSSPVKIKNTRETYSRLRNFGVKALNYVISLLINSLVVTAFTLPVIFICYGNFSLMTPVSSLVLIPIVQILLPLFLFVLIFGGIPLLGAVLAFLASALSGLLLDIASFLADIEGIYVSLRYPFGKYFILALLALIFVFLFGRRVKFRRAAALFAALAIAFAACVGIYEHAYYDKAQTVVLNAARNDGIVMKYGGRTVALDISGGSYSFMRSMADEIYELNAEKIDLLVYSHLHRYHAGTLGKICSVIKLGAVAVPMPQTEAEEEYLAELSQEATAHGIDIFVYGMDAYADMGDMRIYFPEYLRIKRSVHRIPYFSVEIGGEKKLFYAGAGLSELPDFYALAEDAAYPVFGSHGAKYKEKTEVPHGSLILGVAAEYAEGEELHFISDEKYKIIISDK